MREHTINLYSFDELSESAKRIAIENWRARGDFQIETMQINERFREILDEKGYPIDNIEWSLSFSQGDGVAFYGWVDMKKVAERLLDGRRLELFNSIQNEMLTLDVNIIRNSFGYRYSHWNTMRIEIDGDDIDTMIEHLYPNLDEEEYTDTRCYKYKEIEELIEHLEKAITTDVQLTSKDLERSGYEEIEYYNSDEYISEEFRANDFEFTEDGKRWQ